MDFNNKIAVVTGGALGIGRCIAEEFRKAGANVCVIDKQPGDHFVGDLANKDVLERFAKEVIAKHGRVDYLVNNALPLMKGLAECSIKIYCIFAAPLRIFLKNPQRRCGNFVCYVP